MWAPVVQAGASPGSTTQTTLPAASAPGATGAASTGAASTGTASTGAASTGAALTGTASTVPAPGSTGVGGTTQVTVPGATTQRAVPGGTAPGGTAPGATTQVTVPVGASSVAGKGASTVPAAAPLGAPAGTGADTLLGPPAIRHGNQPTFAERYGSSYYGLTEAPSATSTPQSGALGAVTDALWSMVMLLVGFAITVVQWAFHLDLASVIAPSLHHITQTLGRIVFDPWVATVLVVGAAWLVWWGLVRRRVSVAGEGALWMLVAVVAAVAFLAQPTSLLVGADHATSAIGTSALSALAPLAPAPAKAAGATTPGAAYTKGPASDAELRKAANTLWEAYVYEPWLVAEFGSTSAGATAGPAWLALQSHGGTVQAEQAALAGPQSGGSAAQSAAGAGSVTAGGALVGTAGSGTAGSGTAGSGTAGSGTARSGTAGAGTATKATGSTTGAATAATTQAWFAGTYPAGRFGVVLVAFVAAAALCVLLAALALAVLLAQVALVLLVALAPVFLILGVHPGYGRRIALRWAELAVAAVVKRVVYSVALAAVLVVIGTLVALMSAAGVGWAITALLPTLAMVALVVFRGRVIHALLGTGAALAPDRLRGVLTPATPRQANQRHSGVPRRVATHAIPRRPPPAGGRPDWWAATRHRPRPPAPSPMPDASMDSDTDRRSRLEAPEAPDRDRSTEKRNEPAPVP